ncbi:hypothetical protein OM258_17730 [Escherichia albertii]|nr:hypothetical protein [Escherichia albertii]
MNVYDNQNMWFIRKPTCSDKYKALDVHHYIEQYEIINKTPKGWRVKCRYSDKGRVLLKNSYHCFCSEKDALEFLANEANNMAALLDERKLTYVRLLCDCRDALKR